MLPDCFAKKLRAFQSSNRKAWKLSLAFTTAIKKKCSFHFSILVSMLLYIANLISTCFISGEFEYNSVCYTIIICIPCYILFHYLNLQKSKSRNIIHRFLFLVFYGCSWVYVCLSFGKDTVLIFFFVGLKSTINMQSYVKSSD